MGPCSYAQSFTTQEDTTNFKDLSGITVTWRPEVALFRLSFGLMVWKAESLCKCWQIISLFGCKPSFISGTILHFMDMIRFLCRQGEKSFACYATISFNTTTTPHMEEGVEFLTSPPQIIVLFSSHHCFEAWGTMVGECDNSAQLWKGNNSSSAAGASTITPLPILRHKQIHKRGHVYTPVHMHQNKCSQSCLLFFWLSFTCSNPLLHPCYP